MLVYFAPDCEHCQKFMTKLLPHLKKLANLQIVMSTWVQPQAIMRFQNEYKLDKYPNVVIGTEGRDNLMIQTYFGVKETPYVALYNKQGRLTWYYERFANIDHMLEKIAEL